ncbi:MAG: hypothetical protein GXX78_08270 [Bacteroidales bacterium]|jgi:hypothetical protein|nr:hypothetical protein [Bacteroidales bacterium]
MKKIVLYTLALFMIFSVFSCTEDPEVWDSKVLELSGDWFVRYDHESYGEDPFGSGFTPLMTFNTAKDDGTEIWITDDGNFWDYKVKVNVNASNLTFGSDQALVNSVDGYEIGVKIMNGKIIKNAVTQPSGYVSDSIYFEIWFEDLEDATGIANDKLLVGGFKRSGFTEDLH